MKPIIVIIFAASLLMLAGCDSAPSEPKEYTHTLGGFKVTAPAHWKLISEDHELYEFRRGNYKLIEVGSFDLDIPKGDLDMLTPDELSNTLEDESLRGLKNYCEGAKITGYRITERMPYKWDNMPGFRIKAVGYSDAASATMVIDVVMGLEKSQMRLYLFASQVAESDYEETSADLEMTIASFQLL